MDMSTSITDKNFQKQRDFVKAVANTFTMGETETEVGVVTYNHGADLWISFGQYSDNDRFSQAVDKIPYWGGQTRVDTGMQMAKVGLFGAVKGVRIMLPKILVLLTDGRQSSDPSATPLKDAALPLFQLGVKILVVTIGKDVSRDQLRGVVERDQDIIAVDDFEDLLLRTRGIARTICETSRLPSREY